MTLRKQFLTLYHKFTVSDEWEGSLHADAEKIADDFSIGFAEWFLNLSKSDDWEKFDYNTTEKLLKIYKNEKGL